jgi:mannose-6-phosphate isomerase-like protein (cupin superfamily)
MRRTAATGVVRAGDDRLGERHGLGVSVIAFKVITPELLVLENSFHAPGGPPRHLHFDQDEWFCALDGEFVIEVGDARHLLRPGDSVLGPRRVAHVWASTGPGRILVAFSPAGDMEAFFREVTKADAMPSQDPAVWSAHGMEVVGPPLALDPPAAFRGAPH